MGVLDLLKDVKIGGTTKASDHLDCIYLLYNIYSYAFALTNRNQG